jgi:transposase
MIYSKEYMKFYVFIERNNGVTSVEIHKKMVYVIEENSPGLSSIQRWCHQIDKNVFSISDAEKSGRPSTSCTPDTRERIKLLIVENPHYSVRQISDKIDINRESVRLTLIRDLDYRKVCSVWVPHRLTDAHKKARVDCATNMLISLNELGDEVCHVYAVVDETWVQHEPIATKQENKVWLKKDEKRFQIPRPSLTKAKSMMLVIYTADGKFNVETLPYGTTVNSTVYCDFLRQTGDKWRRLHVNPIKLSEIHLQQDNARPHVSAETTDFLKYRGITMIGQSPYSPDFNMLDRWVFPYLKKSLRRQQFSDHKEIKNFSLQLLKELTQERMVHEIDKLKKHLVNVINESGSYIC